MALKQDHEDIACEEDLSLGWTHSASGKHDLFDQTHKVDTEMCTKLKQCAKRENGTDGSNIQQGLTNGRNIHSQEPPHSLEKGQRTLLVNQQVLANDPNHGRIFGQDDQARGFQKPVMEKEVIIYDGEGRRVKVQKTFIYESKEKECLFGSCLSQQGEISGKVSPTTIKKENGSGYHEYSKTVDSKTVDSNSKITTHQASEVQDRVVAASHPLECNLQPRASVAHEYDLNLSDRAIPSKNTQGPMYKNDTKKQNLRDARLSYDVVEAGGKIIQPSNIQTGAENVRECKTNLDKPDVFKQLSDVTRDASSVKSASLEVVNSCKMPQFANEDHQKRSSNLKDHKDQISTRYSRSSMEVKSEYPPEAECKSSKTKSTGNKQEHQLVKQNSKDLQGNVIRSHTLQPVKSYADSCGMQRKYYGSAGCDGKVIILVGASGSGKTTLVDFIANYFKGVETADDEVFQVNSSDYSSTTSITAYTFSFSEKESPITIIDTPGLSNSSGKGVQDHVQSIKTFLANSCSKNFEIHAIGFVAQAHQTHLSSSERLVIDYVSTLFGQVVANHFITFVTFIADVQEAPPVVTAIKDCGMKCKIFVNFNNSTLSSSGVEEINDLDRVYWRIGRKSWKKCLKFLQGLPPLSVNTLKSSQSKVYETTVSESAARNLRAEIKRFIDFCKDSQHMTEEAAQCREQVWGCASVLHRLQSRKESGVSDVTSIMIALTEEVCKENAFRPRDCVELLCLATSRGLLGSGIGIMQGFGPLYECAKTYSKLQGKSDKNLPNTMYCSNCKEEHSIVRTESSGYMSYIPNFGSSDILITFKCQSCECAATSHISKLFVPASQLTWNVPPDELLWLANEGISQVLKKNSPERYVISKDKFLQYVNSATNFKHQALIEDLLKA